MTRPADRGIAQRIFRASLAVGVAHVLFKLAGIVQAKVMAHYLSAETYDVLYAFAFENCIFAIFLVGEESLGPACMPLFMHELKARGEAAAWRFANALLTGQTLLLIGVVGLLMLFPGWIVRLWTAWSPTVNPAAYQLGVASVRGLAPALIGLSLGSTTYVLLNAYKRFFLAAFGDAVWKFASALALILGVGFWGRGGEALLWGLVAGGLLKLLTHLVGLADKRNYVRPRFAFNDPALRRLLLLMLPLLAGILFAKLRDVVNNVYILSVLDQHGLLQANSLGRKLQTTLHWLVPYALSIAMFPYLCDLAVHDDQARMGELITRIGRQLLALFIPFAVVVGVLAAPLTGLLLGGGHFDALAVRRTALTTACYTLVLPAAAIEALLMQAFFANRRMVAVTVAGIGFSSLSMLLSWLGLKLGGGNALILLACVSGGFALSRSLKSIVLVRLLARQTPVFPRRDTLRFLTRVLLAAAAGGAVAWLASSACGRLPAPLAAGHLGELLRLTLGAAAALPVTLAALWLLRVHEPFELAHWLRLKTRRS